MGGVHGAMQDDRESSSRQVVSTVAWHRLYHLQLTSAVSRDGFKSGSICLQPWRIPLMHSYKFVRCRLQLDTMLEHHQSVCNTVLPPLASGACTYVFAYCARHSRTCKTIGMFAQLQWCIMCLSSICPSKP